MAEITYLEKGFSSKKEQSNAMERFLPKKNKTNWDFFLVENCKGFEELHLK